jgi:hypothetical protein
MKKIVIGIFAIVVAFSCDDRLDELNTPKTYPVEVPGDKLFTNGVREMFDMMTNTNVNENVFRLYAQYWAQTTYPDESAYNQVSRKNPDNLFTNAYREALKDMTDGKKFLIANPDPTIDDAQELNMQLIIDINVAYIYSFLVETFGNVPFTEALDPDNIVPKYDDARTVYNAALAMLDNAIAKMDVSKGSFIDAQDPVYGGDAAAWKMFAASLKLRMGIMLADVDPTAAQKIITEALTAGVLSSNDDNTTITYYAAPPSTNPLYEDLVLSGRRDFVVSNTAVDALNKYLDPRVNVFATGMVSFPYQVPVNTKVDSTLTTPMFIKYLAKSGSDSIAVFGAPAGYVVQAKDSLSVRIYSGGQYGYAAGYAGNTKIGPLFFEPDLGGTIMSYSEVQFLLAEAVERGFTLAGSYAGKTSTELYNAGITASFEEWGLTAAEATAYIAQPSVDYATAAGTWKQKIGVQAWLALYNRGYEGWTTWRRLDFTGFNIAETITAVDEIPVRFIYPVDEATLNGASLSAAISAIGVDEMTQKLFWDKN